MPLYINDCIKNYGGGILSDGEGECGCSKDPRAINHAVAIVGFGQHVNKQHPNACYKYWLIKNSWGEDWGEQGFMRLCRDDDKLVNGTCNLR